MMKITDAFTKVFISNTIYGSCYNTLKYLQDYSAHLNLYLHPIEVVWPASDAQLLKTIEETILLLTKNFPERKIRLGLFDAISSLPGVVVPWEAVRLFNLLLF